MEYTSSGDDYTVHVDPGAPAADRYLVIEAYDPAFVFTGPTCPNVPTEPDKFATNGTGSYAEYCAGAGDSTESGSPPAAAPTTNFDIIDPATGANLNTQCNVSEPASSRSLNTFPGDPNSANPSGAGAEPPTSALSWNYFHRWVPICASLPINPTTGTDVIVRVTTGPGDGENNFDLRAAVSTAVAAFDENLNFAGSDHNAYVMTNADFYDPPGSDVLDQTWTQNRTKVGFNTSASLQLAYANGQTRQFPFVRVTPSDAGSTFKWQIYNLGYSSSQGTLSMSTSGDVTGGPSASNCSYAISPSPSVWTSGCSVPFDSTDAGHVISFMWTVPSNYTCNTSDEFSCWVFVNVAGSSTAMDGTTWTLQNGHAPVHLIQ